MYTKPIFRWLPLAALSLATLACSLLGGGGDEPPADPSVLFSDDFSDTSSGWDRTGDDTYSTDYDDGVYRIVVNDTDSDVWANPGRSFTDVSVTVEATKSGGPDDNDFGVVCRYVDASNFYYVVISSDGFYGIFQVVNGEREIISGDHMRESIFIRLGTATNTIRADCVGSTLSLYVNDRPVAEATASDLSSGDVGLIAGTYGEPGTDIAFDNFVVRRP